MKLNPPATVEDLQIVTGLGRDAVLAAIRHGSLPGAKIHGRYVIPADAFEAYCLYGKWPINAEPTPIRPIPDMIKRRSA